MSRMREKKSWASASTKVWACIYTVDWPLECNHMVKITKDIFWQVHHGTINAKWCIQGPHSGFYSYITGSRLWLHVAFSQVGCLVEIMRIMLVCWLSWIPSYRMASGWLRPLPKVISLHSVDHSASWWLSYWVLITSPYLPRLPVLVRISVGTAIGLLYLYKQTYSFRWSKSHSLSPPNQILLFMSDQKQNMLFIHSHEAIFPRFPF